MLPMRHAPLLAAAAILGALHAASWPYTVDDAFIAVRYADRLARGLGYTFVDGPATDGVTGPLWLAPLTLAARLGLAPLETAKVCSAGASLAALALVLARLRQQSLGTCAAWVALLVAVTSLPFVGWAAAGLETGLATLGLTVLTVAVTARHGSVYGEVTRPPRPSLHVGMAGLAAALLPWLRPELLPCTAVLLAALHVRTRGRSRSALVMALLGFVLLVLFRALCFGHALPMVVHAKPAQLGHGLAYVAEIVARPRALVLALVCVMGLRSLGRDGWLLAGMLALHLVVLALAGGDWMPARRLLAPLIPAAALLVGRSVSRLALRQRAWATALSALFVVLGVLEVAPQLASARSAGLTRTRQLAPLVEAVCGASGPVALVDVGALGVACPHVTLLDLGGLTEPAVAYARGVHLAKQVDAHWLRVRNPALIVLHSRERPAYDRERRLRWFAGYPVERRVLAMAFVQRAYRVERVIAYAPRYFYVVLSRPR